MCINILKLEMVNFKYFYFVCLLLVYHMLPASLDGPSLIFSNVYSNVWYAIQLQCSGVTHVHPGFQCGVPVARPVVFCVVFCRLLFVILSVFCWPVCCCLPFDFWFLIAPLVSLTCSSPILLLGCYNIVQKFRYLIYSTNRTLRLK